jgi:hypothetical protein
VYSLVPQPSRRAAWAPQKKNTILADKVELYDKLIATHPGIERNRREQSVYLAQ